MPARAFRREVRASFFAPLVAVALLASIFLWRVSVQVSRGDRVEHSYKVIRATRHAESDLLEMEVAMASYWLSPDKRYLAKLEDGQRDLDTNLARASALVADNASQGQRLLAASSFKGAWVGEFKALIAQRNNGQTSALPLDQLDDQVETVRKVLDEVVVEEDRLLNQRSAAQKSEDRLIYLLVPFLSVLVAVILSYWGWHEIGVVSQRFAEALASAQEASLAKDNFIASVSHELRNPLNSIMLSSGILLSDQTLQGNARQKVMGIERAARTQAQLIEDLLDVARIESGRMRLDVQATDLAQVVEAAVDSMRVAAEAKSIDLQEMIDPSVRLISGDPKRIQQVVWNLISNAVKFTAKGGKVQVRLERINSHVEITVADNGQGIAPAALAHVFDRFWRESDSNQSIPGTGLGLSIVRELVTLHGGTVTAHSDGVGKGSTFIVRLPLPVSTAPLLEPRRHPTVAQIDNVATASRLDGLSILVVDDDPEACDSLTKLLDSLGATASAATSAQAALGKLDGVPPYDAIVADIGMPVEDGFFFAREVRKLEQERGASRRVPLVALTAYGRVDDRIKILASGFDSHVVKPVELGELAETIRSLVVARSSR